MCRKPRIEEVSCPQTRSSQREVCPEASRHRGQEVRGADIGEKADICLGHGKHCFFGCDPEFAMHRDSCAAAHAKAVPDGYLWLWRYSDSGVKLVSATNGRVDEAPA
eukprot:scaffold116410_cov35-Tisochrysis_lutea.AAC.2